MFPEKQAYPNQIYLDIAVQVPQCCLKPKQTKKYDKPREEGYEISLRNLFVLVRVQNELLS